MDMEFYSLDIAKSLSKRQLNESVLKKEDFHKHLDNLLEIIGKENEIKIHFARKSIFLRLMKFIREADDIDFKQTLITHITALWLDENKNFKL